eukprot:Sdes_comp9983_c0_seq1m1551
METMELPDIFRHPLAPIAPYSESVKLWEQNNFKGNSYPLSFMNHNSLSTSTTASRSKLLHPDRSVSYPPFFSEPCSERSFSKNPKSFDLLANNRPSLVLPSVEALSCSSLFSAKPANVHHEPSRAEIYSLSENESPDSLHPSSETCQRLCRICGKLFRRVDTLKQHLMNHNGEKPFKCEKCGQGFKDKSARYKHLKSHSSERPFQCAVCSRTFKLKHHLIRHAKVMHNVVLDFSDVHPRKYLSINKDNILESNSSIYSPATIRPD